MSSINFSIFPPIPSPAFHQNLSYNNKCMRVEMTPCNYYTFYNPRYQHINYCLQGSWNYQRVCCCFSFKHMFCFVFLVVFLFVFQQGKKKFSSLSTLSSWEMFSQWMLFFFPFCLCFLEGPAKEFLSWFFCF